MKRADRGPAWAEIESLPFRGVHPPAKDGKRALVYRLGPFQWVADVYKDTDGDWSYTLPTHTDALAHALEAVGLDAHPEHKEPS